MGRTTVTDRPLLSGWCGYSPDHVRCLGTQPERGLRCECDCHRVELLALPDALAQLCRAVCARDRVTHDPICQTIRHHLRGTS